MDILNPGTKFELFTNNIPRISCATAGLLQKSPIFCGGWDVMCNISQDCVVIGKPEIEMKMIEKRRGAASVALDQNTLWVVGGSGGRIRRITNSTEFIKLGQPSVKGPDLPYSIYIIGGDQNGSFPSKRPGL